MAGPTVSLKVLLEAVGIKATTKQLEALNKNLAGVKVQSKGVSKGMNEVKRNLDGVASRTGRANKDFGRMAQGMGGLVAAYATVAANVFALSSAFLVLRRAADLSSMIKSAENFSSRFGVSVVDITKRMQEASGGALDFAEALPTINKAISAGIGIEQMERLTQAATKAAQTFGGSTTEALSRFISASQRGRVEIIQTLGVVIKTEQAYKDYGATIGKTALELTAFDRQQAILNATIAESERVFAGITIDPNPFQQLLVTVTDLKDVIATFVTDGVTPMLKAFNQSKAAATALIAVIATSVGSRIFPELTAGITKFAKAGLESTRAARAATDKADRRARDVIRQGEKTSTNTSLRAIKKREAAFTKSLGDKLKATSIFNKKILDAENKLNVGILTSKRALLAKEIKLREAGVQKGRQVALAPIQTAALKRELNSLNQVGASIENANIQTKKLGISMQQTSNIIVKGMAKGIAAVSRFNTKIITARSAIKSGFAQGFTVAEGKVVKSIRGMQVAWRIFIRDIGSGAAKANSSLVNLSRLFGRVGGFIAGGLSKLVSFAFSITLAISLATLAWELFGKKLFGISEIQEKLRETIDDTANSLKKITENSIGFISTSDDMTDSNLKFIKNLEFLRGTLDSTLTTLRDFDVVIANAFNGKSFNQALENMDTLRGGIEFFNKLAKNGLDLGNEKAATTSSPFGIGTTDTIQASATVSPLLAKASGAFRENLEISEETLKNIAQNLAPALIDNFVSLNNLLSSQGINTLQVDTVNKLKDTLKDLGTEGKVLTAIFEAGAVDVFFDRIIETGDKELIGKVFADIKSSVESVGDTFDKVNQQIAAARSLQDVDNLIGNFTSGIDKLKSASVPNKEIVNFLLNSRTALQSLVDTGEDLGNIGSITENVIRGEDLANLKAFLNIDDDTKISVALQSAVDKLEVFKGLVVQNTIETNKLKIAALGIKTLKEEEATTDLRRFAVIRETNKLRIAIAKSQLTITKNTIKIEQAALAVLVRAGELKSDEAQDTIKNLGVLGAELKAKEAAVKTAEANKDEQREITKTIIARVKAVQGINNTLIKNERITLSLTNSSSEHLASRIKIFEIEKANLNLRKAALRVEIEGLVTSGFTIQEQAVKEASLRTQIDLINEQTRALERQKGLSIEASDIQGRGQTFTEEGMRNLGAIFSNSILDAVRGLKAVTETLGKGFAKTAIDTLDGAVDKLFEGHGFSGFFDSVVESLKEGLRDTFSEAIKNQIKEAFAGLFSPQTVATNSNTGAVISNTVMLATVNASLIALATAQAVGGGSSVIGNAVGSIFSFGTGGVTPGPIRPLASGGITSGPELALIGEGSQREAVVPLPNNREIPVKLEGGGGDTININTEQNFDFTNANPGTVTQLRAEAKAIEDRTFNRVFTEINKGGKFAKISGRR